MKKSHLTLEQKYEIQHQKEAGKTQSEIAIKAFIDPMTSSHRINKGTKKGDLTSGDFYVVGEENKRSVAFFIIALYSSEHLWIVFRGIKACQPFLIKFQRTIVKDYFL